MFFYNWHSVFGGNERVLCRMFLTFSGLILGAFLKRLAKFLLFCLLAVSFLCLVSHWNDTLRKHWYIPTKNKVSQTFPPSTGRLACDWLPLASSDTWALTQNSYVSFFKKLHCIFYISKLMRDKAHSLRQLLQRCLGGHA